ncbi:hypothetical protein TNCV_2155171 [Trichonephila clavipes]|nr:hypothetical protein TNCV_2155171 [Trichonephila clavipes]
MKVTPRKRSKIIAPYEKASTIARDIAPAFGVGKTSVLRILIVFQASGTSSLNRKGKYRRKWKVSPRNDKIVIRNCKTYTRKTSIDLQKDLLEYSVEVHISIVRKSIWKSVIRQQARV